ncbi:MAG TPA: ATP-binding protein [Thermoanaerobaculia bacterium]|jgi:signal transduction histidine kinase
MTTDVADDEERRRSAERQAELQRLISRSALEWRLTFDAIASPLLLVEMGGRIIRMNEAARDLGGVSYEGAIHHPLAVLGNREPWRSVLALLDEVAASGRRASAQARGEEGRTWDGSVSPVAGPDGERWAVIVILDITDTVRLQESLRRSETMSAMGALVAGVAHEVRNPLFGISATLDAFESKFKRRTEYRRYVDVLRERVGRLNELMRQLLEYGKPPRLDLAEACPREVMAAAADACAPLAAQAGVAVELEADPGVPRLTIDRGRVVQVLENLLENAIQHSPPGGRVGFRALATEGGVRFAVEDAGPGFRPEDFDRLFEPFFTRRRGGTGLGLSIVQRIAEQHGGRVVAANRPDGGAVMTVTLPAAPAAPLRSRRLPPA